MSTKKASVETAKTYKKLLLKCLALRKQGGKSAFERTKLLVSVFENQEFRLDNGNLDDFKLAEVLDQYVEDVFLDEENVFLKLKAMLDHFPNESQWESGKLRTMYNEMLESRLLPTKEVKPRKAASLAQVADLKNQLRQEKARNLRLQKENNDLQNKLQEALCEIERLKRQLK